MVETTIISVDLSDFSPDEIANFRRLCAEYKFSPAQFFVYATIPKMDANRMKLTARIVHVEFLSSKKEKAYPASVEQNWIASFTRDLRSGFYVDRK